MDTKLVKSDYRSFNIKTVTKTADDYASMKEALLRRLSHLSDPQGTFSIRPDLILLDGGKGHVSVVRELMRAQGLDIPVFGMVKDEYHKTRALCTEYEEISIARENLVYMFIYKLQEEVHRYTISKMDNAKRKTLTTSTLTNIKGIGEVKAKLLLKTFGGMTGVSNASFEQLINTKSLSQKDAQNIIEYFKKVNR